MRKYLQLLLVVFLFFLSPFPAISAHVPVNNEELLSHNLSHLLFVVGFVLLLLQGRHGRMPGKGWRQFDRFLVMTLIWSILTSLHHFIEIFLDQDQFLRQGGRVIAFHLESMSDLLFYLSSMDQLLLFPALLFFMAALRQWSHFSGDLR